MKVVRIVIIATVLGITLILSTFISCTVIGIINASSYADCDTTRFVAADRHYIKIHCVETDTIYVQPDYPCIRECLELNGLGHWEDCLEGCLND